MFVFDFSTLNVDIQPSTGNEPPELSSSFFDIFHFYDVGGIQAATFND